MNKQTYELFKQQNLGARMAKAVEQHRKFIGIADDELTTKPVPNRAARRRMGNHWKRINMEAQ